ncbi:two-component sensor histidine kinase [Panacibacter ginsenosidivorans]|uniref:histidine kinase n=1 Tax=Panacibacter ginsenosidivorans TaxID=1813871 RepID=A0A5B8V9G3_9BACT|nr:ATP-binding protein [Panacibacter ginsenosidivorans]QEC68160.1 two-component sensor histidine kinase [Panacibacter ginsenosidivorans]
MIRRLRKQRLAFITLVYWFLLIYIIAALVWWFISLEQQNDLMYSYRLSELNKDDPSYTQKITQLQEERERKTAQYIGEGSTFLLLILLGAVFVYRATRKQIRLSQQQQNFMMAVTHELKTPIAVTRLNLETLQKRKLDEQQQEKLISLALDETNRLNLLTNNILVASQLESGNYIVNKQRVDFSAITREAIADFTKRFRTRTIQAEVTNNIFIEGELMLLQMLINNLVENALKYSSKDKPVWVKLYSDGNAVLKVIDEGAGIQSSEKKKIFDKFYRSGDESVRTTKGTGLGLYLCKRIVKDHKGTISVEDNKPVGSVFTVTIPVI